MASQIINEQWYADRDTDVDKESERIAAAKVIRAIIQDTD
jgi:hypothetical protein